MTTPRWYMVDKMGMATLCKNKKDAGKEARAMDMAWPHMGPHRAVQLVEVASVAANAGSEPVAEVMFADGKKYIQYTVPKELLPVGAKLYTHPSPPEGMVGGWISVEDVRKPPPGKPVVLWVWGERYQEDDDGRQIAQDASGLHLGEWREAEHGNYFDNYSTPFADREAVLWWMDPAPPTTSAGSGKGE